MPHVQTVSDLTLHARDLIHGGSSPFSRAAVSTCLWMCGCFRRCPPAYTALTRYILPFLLKYTMHPEQCVSYKLEKLSL